MARVADSARFRRAGPGCSEGRPKRSRIAFCSGKAGGSARAKAAHFTTAIWTAHPKEVSHSMLCRECCQGASIAESAGVNRRQPSEPDPGHSGEGTATIDSSMATAIGVFCSREYSVTAFDADRPCPRRSLSLVPIPAVAPEYRRSQNLRCARRLRDQRHYRGDGSEHSRGDRGRRGPEEIGQPSSTRCWRTLAPERSRRGCFRARRLFRRSPTGARWGLRPSSTGHDLRRELPARSGCRGRHQTGTIPAR